METFELLLEFMKRLLLSVSHDISLSIFDILPYILRANVLQSAIITLCTGQDTFVHSDIFVYRIIYMEKGGINNIFFQRFQNFHHVHHVKSTYIVHSFCSSSYNKFLAYLLFFVSPMRYTVLHLQGTNIRIDQKKTFCCRKV